MEPSKCHANFVLDFSFLNFFLAFKIFSQLFSRLYAFFLTFFSQLFLDLGAAGIDWCISFNFNIYTDTSVCKLYNGTTVRLITTGELSKSPPRVIAQALIRGIWYTGFFPGNLVFLGKLMFMCFINETLTKEILKPTLIFPPGLRYVDDGLRKIKGSWAGGGCCGDPFGLHEHFTKEVLQNESWFLLCFICSTHHHAPTCSSSLRR